MIAEVIINSNAKDLDQTFDYKVPEEMKDRGYSLPWYDIPIENAEKCNS